MQMIGATCKDLVINQQWRGALSSHEGTFSKVDIFFGVVGTTCIFITQ